MFNLRALTLFATFSAVATSVLAQDHSSEQSEAQISDPTQECTPYSYPPVAQNLANFPTIWQPATLLASDTAGQAMWSRISGGVPNIAPKGQLNNSANGTVYNAATDPDCWWTALHCTTPKLPGLPSDLTTVPEPKTLGYGFDDGPNCTHNAFYDFLASQNQKATLFYIGSNVMDWPYEAQRGLVDGHEICAHTWSHRYMTAFASEDAFAELWYSIQAIKLVLNVTVTCWRPPYGDVDDRIRYIANAMGLQTIIWQSDSNDWRVGLNNITAADVDNSYQWLINNVTAGTFNGQGTTFLTHELNSFTMSEAIKWYSQLSSAFSHMVPIGVALNKTHPYNETNYTLPTFEQCISGSASSSNGSSSPSASASASSNNKSSAYHITVPCGVWWTLLSAVTMLLFGLGL
ncbi:chitin deacetylase [Russula dissimulans]|nr:chitin deacetylase [Russula dissimulans]